MQFLGCLNRKKFALISDVKDFCVYKSTVGSALKLTHVKQIKGHNGGGEPLKLLSASYMVLCYYFLSQVKIQHHTMPYTLHLSLLPYFNKFSHTILTTFTVKQVLFVHTIFRNMKPPFNCNPNCPQLWK